MRPLRVLHVNTSDEGGAARAASRIHLSLRQMGVDSQMMVMQRGRASPHVMEPSMACRAWNRLTAALGDSLVALQRVPSNPVMHSINLMPSGLARWINRSDFDVVNLHWLGGEILSVEEIGHVRKPLCWTLHDMWAFSGAEHYDDFQHPGRYREAYGAGNRAHGARGPDLDAWTWRRKRRAWAGQNFTLISPSRWMADCARRSALMGSHRSTVIPNCLDTDCFKPTPRALARQMLGLDPDKQYILFGAASGTSDPRKGFRLLQAALHSLCQSQTMAARPELLVFGISTNADLAALPLPVRAFGVVHDDARLALLYSAADVFAVPSMQDNLPNTVAESLACGTPCVAFRVGGMADLISHGQTGWLAEPFMESDFCQGLASILVGASLRERCRAEALEKYQMRGVAAQYEQTYREAIAGCSK